jgi:hypothetical protein
MASYGVLPEPRPKFSGRPWYATFTNVAPHAHLSFPVIFGKDFIGLTDFHYSAPAKEANNFRLFSCAVSTSGIILGSWPAFRS